MAQTAQFQLRNSSDNIVSGQASNLAFRVSPYSSGDVIAGLTFTENPVSSGVYIVTGISAYYKDVKLFLSGTEQPAYGVFDIGSPAFNFVELAGSQTITGVKTFSSSPIVPQATTNGQAMRYQDTVRTTDDQNIDGHKVFLDIPKTSAGRTYTGNQQEIPDVQYLQENYGTGGGSPFKINVNKLFVDADASAVTGKIYTTIQGAITYASTQSPSVTSRWTIIIMPHKSAGYAEDITLVRFVDLIGWGDVYITGGLTTTQITTAQTWGARDARIENLIFNSTDKSYFFRLLHIKNCMAKANGAGGEVSFYIDGCNMREFGIFTQNDVDLQANNTEQENRGTAFGNEEPVWETNDDTNFRLLNTLWEF